MLERNVEAAPHAKMDAGASWKANINGIGATMDIDKHALRPCARSRRSVDRAAAARKAE
jgi:hypothetical protein